MKSSVVMEIINRIEEGFPVEKWSINGIHVWPIIRIIIYFRLIDATMHDSPFLSRPVRWSRLVSTFSAKAIQFARFAYAYLSDISQNANTSQPAEIVFLSDGLSRVKIKGIWYEKHFDPILEYFVGNQHNCLVLEASHYYSIPRFTPSAFIQAHLDWLTMKQLGKHDLPIVAEEEELDGFREFISYLKTLNFKTDWIELDAIRLNVHRIIAASEYFASILKETGAKLAFTVNYFNIAGMAFNLACYKCQIPSVEIQHGVQNDLHAAYGRWTKLPSSGYNLLPSIFSVWSSEEVDTIERWNSSVRRFHKAVMSGNPWLNIWLHEEADFVDFYDGQIKKAMATKPSAQNILFTVQDGFSDPRVIENVLCAIAETQNSWSWWIRLHPTMTDKATTEAFRNVLHKASISECHVELATNLPLYALLRNMDAHVTFSSATVIEAEYFRVFSVITSEFGAELFPKQIRSGYALYALNTEEIIEAIRIQIEKKKHSRKNAYSVPASSKKSLLYFLSTLEESKNGCNK